MVFKDMSDIERENEAKERERMKERVVEDINDVFSNVLKKRKQDKDKKKKKRKWWVKLILALLTLGLLLLVANFVLGNIWLLKFFIKDLFSGFKI